MRDFSDGFFEGQAEMWFALTGLDPALEAPGEEFSVTPSRTDPHERSLFPAGHPFWDGRAGMADTIVPYAGSSAQARLEYARHAAETAQIPGGESPFMPGEFSAPPEASFLGGAYESAASPAGMSLALENGAVTPPLPAPLSGIAGRALAQTLSDSLELDALRYDRSWRE